jgi:pimeloyl-ACP methyl ester carboxylesterase
MSAAATQEVLERQVTVNGSKCRVLECGEGEPLYVLHGLGGLQRWTPFLGELAEGRRVIAPSLPGQQGSERGHELLNCQLDWVAMTLDLLEAVGAEGPIDLIGMSTSGMLAGEVAALSQETLRRLVLVGSFGLFDVDDPTTNVYAISPELRAGYLTADADAYLAAYGPGGELSFEEEEDFQAIAYRADESAARLFWPLGDMKLGRRLHRIVAPTLLLWGAEDQLSPPRYADRFANGISGPTQVEIVEGAGHLAFVDAPEQCAATVGEFLSKG